MSHREKREGRGGGRERGREGENKEGGREQGGGSTSESCIILYNNILVNINAS